MLREISQSFNNGSARKFQVLDIAAADLQGLIDLMPAGQSVFNPTPTGAVGTERVFPTAYVECLASCFDKTNRKYSTSYVGVKYGKPTLTDDDIKLALLGKVDTPLGSPSDHVSISKFKEVA